MSAEPATLVEMVGALDPRLRARLSSIRVQTYNEPEGLRAEVELSIHLYLPAGSGRSGAGRYDVRIDLDNLPEGVSFGGIERYPDIVRPLSLVTSVPEQIRDLHASGLVGRLDAIRGERKGDAWTARGGQKVAVPRDPRQGRFYWIIKTHAGSDSERRAWIRSIPSALRTSGAVPAAPAPQQQEES